jgi:hypothetical protein
MKSAETKVARRSRSKPKTKSAPGRIRYSSFVIVPSDTWNLVPNANYINACMQKDEINKMCRNIEIQSMKNWKRIHPGGKMESYLVFKGNMIKNTNKTNKKKRPLNLYKKLWDQA